MAQVSFVAGTNATLNGYARAAADALGQYWRNVSGTSEDMVTYLGEFGEPVTTYLDRPRKLESVSKYPLIYIRPGAAVVGFEGDTNTSALVRLVSAASRWSIVTRNWVASVVGSTTGTASASAMDSG